MLPTFDSVEKLEILSHGKKDFKWLGLTVLSTLHNEENEKFFLVEKIFPILRIDSVTNFGQFKNQEILYHGKTFPSVANFG